MISAFHVARQSCRVSVLQALRSKSYVVGNSQNVIKKIDAKNTVKCLSPFSTSQSVLTSSGEHSHSSLWTAERALSAGLLGLLPVGLAFPNPFFDYTLSLALIAHVHWGIEAIVVDYVRPSVVGDTLSRIAAASVYALSVFALGGLFYFNYSDVGLCQAIRMLWKL